MTGLESQLLINLPQQVLIFSMIPLQKRPINLIVAFHMNCSAILLHTQTTNDRRLSMRRFTQFYLTCLRDHSQHQQTPHLPSFLAIKKAPIVLLSPLKHRLSSISRLVFSLFFPRHRPPLQHPRAPQEQNQKHSSQYRTHLELRRNKPPSSILWLFLSSLGSNLLVQPWSHQRPTANNNKRSNAS